MVFALELIYDPSPSLNLRILEGGNQAAQKVFYDVMRSGQNAENLFGQVAKQINKEIQDIKRGDSFHMLVEKALRSFLEKRNFQRGRQILNLLRFLQLLSEGHNDELQNFMRFQENARVNHNVLDLCQKLSEKLVENLSEANYYVLVQCFDSLTEFIQGPCTENQRVLADGSVLKVINRILDYSHRSELSFLKDLAHSKEKLVIQQKLTFRKLRKQLIVDTSALREHGEEVFRKDYLLSQDPRQLSLKIAQTMVLAAGDASGADGKTARTLSATTSQRTARENQAQSSRSVAARVTQFVDTLNPMIRDQLNEAVELHSFYCEPWMMRRINHKILIHLESILEGNEDSLIVKRARDQVSLKNLVDNMVSVHKHYRVLYDNYQQEIFTHFNFHLDRAKYTSELIIENGFRIFGIAKFYQYYENKLRGGAKYDEFSLEQMASFIGEQLNLDLTSKKPPAAARKQFSAQQEKIKNIQETLKFFQSNTCYVEIQRGAQVFKIFFARPPYCNIQKYSKYAQNFLEEVDRSSVKSKLISLMENSQDLIEQMKMEQGLKELDFTKLFNLNWIRTFCFVLVIHRGRGRLPPPIRESE